MKVRAIKKDPDLKPVYLKKNSTPEQLNDSGAKLLGILYGKSSSQTLDDLRCQLFVKAAPRTNSNLARLPSIQDAQHLCFRVYHQVQKWVGHEISPMQ